MLVKIIQLLFNYYSIISQLLDNCISKPRTQSFENRFRESAGRGSCRASAGTQRADGDLSKVWRATFGKSRSDANSERTGAGMLDESVWATLRRDAGLVAGNVRAVVLPLVAPYY